MTYAVHCNMFQISNHYIYGHKERKLIIALKNEYRQKRKKKHFHIEKGNLSRKSILLKKH